MRIVKTSSTAQEDSSFKQSVDTDINNIVMAMQKRIEIEDNLKGGIFSVSDTGSSDAEFTVTHNLGFTPTNYIVSSISNAGTVYTSGTWSTSVAKFKCSSANAAIKVVLLP